MDIIDWLLISEEPWTRYKTLVDLLGRSANDPEVTNAKKEMILHPNVQSLISKAKTWGEKPIKRHNDAAHPLYAISTLADFGMHGDDPDIQVIVDTLIENQSFEGAFQSPVFIPSAFGGPNESMWTWVNCDAPTVLYALLSFGYKDQGRIYPAINHLVSLVEHDGYHCAAAPELGRFKGPGKRTDPCPIANLYALKALSLFPEFYGNQAVKSAAEMLLSHWANERGKKYFLFGVGTNYRKLKYPFVWYDILHVVDVLSRFEFVHEDQRFQEILETIIEQADVNGSYTASSMYQAWRGWSFANKKVPSAWLTFLVYRIQKRINPTAILLRSG